MKILRLRHAKLVAAVVAIVNVLLIYYVWKSTMWKNLANSAVGVEPQNPQDLAAAHFRSAKEKARNANKHIRKSITIIFRTFYPFEHDLQESIDSILDVVPNLPILLLQDGQLYPPVVYERNLTADEEQTVRFVNLAFDAQKSPDEVRPLDLIKTKFVLFMPDSVRLNNKNLLQKILKEITAPRPFSIFTNVVKSAPAAAAAGGDAIVKHMIVVPFAGTIKTQIYCAQIHLDLPNWTIQYTAINGTKLCDLYLQKHALLVDVGVLRALPDPFASPFPELLYIQTKLANITTSVFTHPFQNGRTLFASYHTKQRRLEIRRREFKRMYKDLQIKRIVRRARKLHSKTEPKDTSTGPQHNLVLDAQFSSSNFSWPAVTDIDLIGCDRTTKSCIGTVYNNRPFYVHLGKHTPPCCLDKLKTTFNHVLEEFENVGIRYWLDNHSLKTAVEVHQLSPDAFDIDIAFNVNDLERSNALKKSQTKPFIDNDGFYWIKATDGHYFHVQFSKINQVGVNLLPFEINGNEVSPSGFFGKKAKSFSADFLHPMSTVLFMGKKIMCPNNVVEFLELKSVT